MYTYQKLSTKNSSRSNNSARLAAAKPFQASTSCCVGTDVSGAGPRGVGGERRGGEAKGSLGVSTDQLDDDAVGSSFSCSACWSSMPLVGSVVPIGLTGKSQEGILV